jgi:hypothetical protein
MTNMTTFQRLFAVVALLLLSACGGGSGGGAGSSGFGGGGGGGSGTGGGGGTTTVTPTAASLVLTLSASSIANDGSQTVTATATTLDSSNNTVAGVPVTFSGDSGVITPAGSATDNSGKLTALIGIGSKTSGIINLTASSGSLTRSAALNVVGTSGSSTAVSLIFSLSATNIANDGSQTVTATAVALDANNNTVPNVPVTITADSGVVTPGGAVTNTAGILMATVGIGAKTTGTINLTASSGALNKTAALTLVSASSSAGAPKVTVALLPAGTTTVTSASPITVTATVTDTTGNPVAGSVVAFKTSLGLGSFSAASALTNASGVATVTVSPASSSVSGADTIVASTTVGSTAVSGSIGFSLVASSASISGFVSATGAAPGQALSAYGQTVLTVSLAGVSAATPVTVNINSSCVALGKAKISPASFSATSSPVVFTYQDTGGCGSTLPSDSLTASISGTAAQKSQPLYLSSPAANNIVFVSATPSTIYLQGTGLTTSSQVIFQVNDAANNPLPNQSVTLALSTSAGGLSLTGQSPQTSNSAGQVSILVNSGTIPTPARVVASLPSGISTVSSNLAVAVGLPSQLNFSLSQATINIEGMSRDGTLNSYTVIASDRLGNPVPDNTAINFISEGGQVQAIAYTATVNGLSRAAAQFQSSAPRPPDGRITVLAYGQGEKSFVDANGDNVYASSEFFQDLGNPYLDTLYNGTFAPSALSPNPNQFIAQSPAGTAACNTDASPSALPASLQLDISVPSQPNTCSGSWGKVYVRRAAETIFSTSAARPVWGSSWPTGAAVSGSSCSSLSLIRPNLPGLPAYDATGVAQTATYYPFGSTGLYGLGATGVLTFFASDANSTALNPVAAGSTITASGTTGITAAVAGGSPVPSTNAPSAVAIKYSFDTVASGTITVTITSPNGLATTYTQTVSQLAVPSGFHVCP